MVGTSTVIMFHGSMCFPLLVSYIVYSVLYDPLNKKTIKTIKKHINLRGMAPQFRDVGQLARALYKLQRRVWCSPQPWQLRRDPIQHAAVVGAGCVDLAEGVVTQWGRLLPSPRPPTRQAKPNQDPCQTSGRIAYAWAYMVASTAAHTTVWHIMTWYGIRPIVCRVRLDIHAGDACWIYHHAPQATTAHSYVGQPACGHMSA